MNTGADLVGIRSSLYKPLAAECVSRMAEAIFEVHADSGVAVNFEEAVDACIENVRR